MGADRLLVRRRRVSSPNTLTLNGLDSQVRPTAPPCWVRRPGRPGAVLAPAAESVASIVRDTRGLGDQGEGRQLANRRLASHAVKNRRLSDDDLLAAIDEVGHRLLPGVVRKI